jgi:hypothetical protein
MLTLNHSPEASKLPAVAKTYDFQDFNFIVSNYFKIEIRLLFKIMKKDDVKLQTMPFLNVSL